DHGSYTFTVALPSRQTTTITASDGTFSNFATVQVIDHKPTLTNVQANPTTINTGQTVSLSGSINDPDPGDTFKLIVEWGDGAQATESPPLPAGTTSFLETHTYNNTGTFDITVFVKDRANSASTVSFAQVIVVGPTSPTYPLSGPASVNEGSLYTL